MMIPYKTIELCTRMSIGVCLALSDGTSLGAGIAEFVTFCRESNAKMQSETLIIRPTIRGKDNARRTFQGIVTWYLYLSGEDVSLYGTGSFPISAFVYGPNSTETYPLSVDIQTGSFLVT